MKDIYVITWTEGILGVQSALSRHRLYPRKPAASMTRGPGSSSCPTTTTSMASPSLHQRRHIIPQGLRVTVMFVNKYVTITIACVHDCCRVSESQAEPQDHPGFSTQPGGNNTEVNSCLVAFRLCCLDGQLL